MVWSDMPTSQSNSVAHVWDGAHIGISGVAGYVLVHFRSTKSLHPASLAAPTLSPSSATVAMPVEMIMGLPVEATLRISGKSVFSNEAIL